MSDWYSASVGSIGQAFGGGGSIYAPPSNYTPAVDERAFNTTPAVDQRAFSDPMGPGSSFWRGVSDPMARFEAQANAALAKSVGTGTTPGSTPGSTATGQFSGDLSVLNQYDPAFQAAAKATGLSANHLKAVAAEEGGWGASAVSGAGAVGLMQVMPGGYPSLEAQYPDWQTDPTQNIMLGAAILKQKIAENGGDVALGTQRYLGVGTDPFTGVTTDDYWSKIQGYWSELDSSGGAFPSSPAGGSTQFGATSLPAMFGAGASVPDWGEFDAPSSNGLYGYSTEYGMNGSNHTGLDIPLTPGSPMRAAFSGHVVCAGTGVGTGEDACAAFNCIDYCAGGTAGRIEIMSDDGNTVLIYGHSSTSGVKAGQRINAGDLVGTSGGENSGHVHLEARVRDSSMPSGWRIVDPRTVIGGSIPAGGSTGTTGGTTPAQPTTSGPWFKSGTPEQLFHLGGN